VISSLSKHPSLITIARVSFTRFCKRYVSKTRGELKGKGVSLADENKARVGTIIGCHVSLGAVFRVSWYSRILKTISSMVRSDVSTTWASGLWIRGELDRVESK